MAGGGLRGILNPSQSPFKKGRIIIACEESPLYKNSADVEKRMPKIRGLNALCCLKGIIPLKRTFRGLDFDYRASFCKVLDLGDGSGQNMAD